jgi:hypothetical protein
MKFARIAYRIAAVYGILVLVPLYFLIDKIGHDSPPAVTHAEFYYGFIGVALLWQLVFILIATDPARYRPIMLISILEKIVYTIPVLILYSSGKASGSTLVPALIDPIFGVLFVTAYVKTRDIRQTTGLH